MTPNSRGWVAKSRHGAPLRRGHAVSVEPSVMNLRGWKWAIEELNLGPHAYQPPLVPPPIPTLDDIDVVLSLKTYARPLRMPCDVGIHHQSKSG